MSLGNKSEDSSFSFSLAAPSMLCKIGDSFQQNAVLNSVRRHMDLIEIRPETSLYGLHFCTSLTVSSWMVECVWRVRKRLRNQSGSLLSQHLSSYYWKMVKSRTSWLPLETGQCRDSFYTRQ